MSIPGQATLLEVALQYLESELLPTLEGEHRFKTRLAINALRIVQREGAALQDSLASTEPELSPEQLALGIRNGEISIKDSAIQAHLKKSLEKALAINNPKWLKRK
jgi:Domain of unknown function (DUF6285)